jgi:hypothetical protein
MASCKLQIQHVDGITAARVCAADIAVAVINRQQTACHAALSGKPTAIYIIPAYGAAFFQHTAPACNMQPDKEMYATHSFKVELTSCRMYVLKKDACCRALTPSRLMI